MSSLNEYLEKTKGSLSGFSSFIDLAVQFDSKWHRGANNQAWFRYRNMVVQGTDLNYYYEGVLFSCCGLGMGDLHNVMVAWKMKNYHCLPSASSYIIADLGW